MKKLFLLIPLLFACVSCGGNTPSTTDENTSQTTSTSESQSSSSEESIVSNWPAVQGEFVKTYLNGNLPYLSDFNVYYYGDVVGSTKPYINPAILGATKDYTSTYENLLVGMGYRYDSSDNESGYTKRIYVKGDYVVTTAYYRGSDNKMWFDVYGYNDKDPSYDYSSYTKVLDYTDFPRYSTDKQSFSKDVFSIDITAGGKQNNTIQLRKMDGKMIIKSTQSFKELNLAFTQYAYSCFVKAGTSESNAKLIYNDANVYKLSENCNYFEIYTNSANKQTNMLSIYFK